MPYAIGSLKRPMGEADIAAKFTGLVEPILGKKQAADLLNLAWAVAELEDVSEICRASVAR
ncbi:hypothetical protein D3C83_203710 [compost metagenome]